MLLEMMRSCGAPGRKRARLSRLCSASRSFPKRSMAWEPRHGGSTWQMLSSIHERAPTDCIWPAEIALQPPELPCGWLGIPGPFAARMSSPMVGCSVPADFSKIIHRVRSAPGSKCARVLCAFSKKATRSALSLAHEGIRIAQTAGSIDLEMLGRAVAGLALVASGSVADGMRILDEVSAAVIAGELTDRVAIGLCGCYLIAACERVRDFERAVQWCRRLKEFCAKWGLRPLFAVCRTQYASICLWRGTWGEAEQELCAASEELAACRPAMKGDALVRLAELRRRQGRLAESAAIVEQLAPHGAGLLARARLALDCDDPGGALELIEQYLRHLPILNRIDRASGLELAVQAHTDLRGWPGAKAALDQLREIAAIVGTIPLRADLSFASGYAAMGKGNANEARLCFEDACEMYTRSGAPFETGRARIQLARALGALGRGNAGVEELCRGKAILSGLNAGLEVARAEKLLSDLLLPHSIDPANSQKAEPGELTGREIEVLRLVAEGLSNDSIAQRLFLSEHTVHRHLANILNKLDVPTRAAAVAQATRRGLLA